jgi:hypothetical protein
MDYFARARHNATPPDEGPYLQSRLNHLYPRPVPQPILCRAGPATVARRNPLARGPRPLVDDGPYSQLEARIDHSRTHDATE